MNETINPIHVHLRLVDLDVYWDNQMVADMILPDGRKMHLRDETLIRQILDDKGITPATKEKLGL